MIFVRFTVNVSVQRIIDSLSTLVIHPISTRVKDCSIETRISIFVRMFWIILTFSLSFFDCQTILHFICINQRLDGYECRPTAINYVTEFNDGLVFVVVHYFLYSQNDFAVVFIGFFEQFRIRNFTFLVQIIHTQALDFIGSVNHFIILFVEQTQSYLQGQSSTACNSSFLFWTYVQCSVFGDVI